MIGLNRKIGLRVLESSLENKSEAETESSFEGSNSITEPEKAGGS